MAIFTLVLAFYTAELARVASKQTKVLQNTDIAIHETSKAANDANKLNAAALRPWVSAPPTVGADFIYDANGARIPFS